MHAEHPRLVTGGRNHAARSAIAHRDRLAAQLRVVALLHRGKEGVHVDMDDLALHAVSVRWRTRNLIRLGLDSEPNSRLEQNKNICRSESINAGPARSRRTMPHVGRQGNTFRGTRCCDQLLLPAWRLPPF